MKFIYGERELTLEFRENEVQVITIENREYFSAFLQKNFASEQTKGKITRRGCRKNGDPDGPCHGGKGALGEKRRKNDKACGRSRP